MSIRLGKFRCQNYINEFNRCRNRATKLAIIQLQKQLQQQQQQDKTPSLHQRIWICDNCFKVKFLNDIKLKINYYKLQTYQRLSLILSD